MRRKRTRESNFQASRLQSSIQRQPQKQHPTAQPELHQQEQVLTPSEPTPLEQAGNVLNRVSEQPSDTGALTPGQLGVQAQLTVGPANDPYEQEADRVAAQVVSNINQPASQAESQAARQAERSSINQPIQRETDTTDEDVQRKPLDAIQQGHVQANPVQYNFLQRSTNVSPYSGPVSADFERNLNQARSGGQPLAPNLQQKMGNAMGADFSGVRVHTDNTSDRLNHTIQAKAFTTGQDVFFKQGAYNPNSRGGQELIAHELTHVVQQKGDTVQRHTVQPNTIQRTFVLNQSDEAPIDRHFKGHGTDEDKAKKKAERKNWATFINRLEACFTGDDDSPPDDLRASLIYNAIARYEKDPPALTPQRLYRKIKENFGQDEKALQENLHDEAAATPDEQTARNLTKLCAVALQEYKRFGEITGELAALGGKRDEDRKAIFRAFPGIKGMERAAFKAVIKKGGNANLLTDILASSIVYDDIEDCWKGAEKIKDWAASNAETHQVSMFKNRFKEGKQKDGELPAASYRDMLINFTMPSGNMIEIQLHVKGLLDKKSDGHKDYENQRNVAEPLAFAQQYIHRFKAHWNSLKHDPVYGQSTVRLISSRLQKLSDAIINDGQHGTIDSNKAAALEAEANQIPQALLPFPKGDSVNLFFLLWVTNKAEVEAAGAEVIRLVESSVVAQNEIYNQAWGDEQQKMIAQGNYTADNIDEQLIKKIQAVDIPVATKPNSQDPIEKSVNINAAYNHHFNAGGRLLKLHGPMYEEAKTFVDAKVAMRKDLLASPKSAARMVRDLARENDAYSGGLAPAIKRRQSRHDVEDGRNDAYWAPREKKKGGGAKAAVVDQSDSSATEMDQQDLGNNNRQRKVRFADEPPAKVPQDDAQD
ncbi:MAG: DUF4157 domain-containing protein [Cyanobacteria bacterium P01_F01_bin.150]